MSTTTPTVDSPAHATSTVSQEAPVSSNGCCMACGQPLTHTFVDLGKQPLSQSFLRAEDLMKMEPFFPLHAFVCSSCSLVQVPPVVSAESIFSDYAYFSSFSDSWLAHAARYVEMATERFHLDGDSFVVELASNDGYLLKNFVEREIPCLGIEPARNIAEVAQERGIPTLSEFFDLRLAEELASSGRSADLIVGANVLAQVPPIHDFVAGIQRLLKPHGVVTIEFPHLLQLMEHNQFDTVYHEHFFYFTLSVVERIFAEHGLRIFDVDELSTHGGSLRIYGCLEGNTDQPTRPAVDAMRETEANYGLEGMDRYQQFRERVDRVKRDALAFLIQAKNEGKSVAAYGAPAKGNTLLNFCGIRTDFIDYAVDRSDHKQGLFTPGTHIPIHHPDRLRETKPDYVVVMPWNLKDEIVAQHAYIREWGGKFVVFVPEVEVIE